MFFSATIGLSIVFVVVVLSPDIPVVYHAMLCIPNLALENAMACRVHRAVKLGLIKNPQSTHFGITIRSHSAADKMALEFAFKRDTLDESRSMPVNVNFTTTDTKTDFA